MKFIMIVTTKHQVTGEAEEAVVTSEEESEDVESKRFDGHLTDIHHIAICDRHPSAVHHLYHRHHHYCRLFLYSSIPG